MPRLDQPLMFEPFLRPQVWGGIGLQRLLNKRPTARGPLGESWEISGLPDHPSRVADGLFGGSLLPDLWSEYREDFVGEALCRESPSQANTTKNFPLLVKWLDCRDRLSVQVHPDDARARELLQQPNGKSEAWVVVESDDRSLVYAGLKPGVTQVDLEKCLHDGTVESCLHSFTPRAGDCISLPAGTIHAASGLMLAEVQQPSDATFRLFDWNRLDAQGRPRTLHLEQGLRCINWPQSPVEPLHPQETTSTHGALRSENVLRGSSFWIDRFTVHDMWDAPFGSEMTIWMVLEGNAKLTDRVQPSTRLLPRGSTVLIPAAAPPQIWQPIQSDQPCTLLCLRAPIVTKDVT